MNANNHQQTTTRRTGSAESEEVLGGLKGKGPREVLGAVAPNRLGLALAQATGGCVLLMALLTYVPYLVHQNAAAKTAEKKATAKETEKKDTADPAKPEMNPVAEKKTTETKTTTADSKKDQGKPSKDIVDKLRENDVKKDKPKDPFGTNIDDLIDKK